MSKNEANEGKNTKGAVEKLKKDLDEVINAGQPSKESTNAIFSLLSAYENDNANDDKNGLKALQKMTPKPKPEFIKRVKDALEKQSESPDEKAREESSQNLEGRNTEAGRVAQNTGASRVDAIEQKDMKREGAITYDTQESNSDANDTEYEAKKITDEEKKKEGDIDLEVDDAPAPPSPSNSGPST